ncbi:phosphohistidine phosphatase SixA [Oleiharenicola lentus]|jgi:phosphohistidine phosphatase|uniref:Phosphohistidine phosphatase SixA n=2 Tax=Oleiharenicola lentus TaxID=2508720 RepID=A0A4Q1C8T9_9BACT|nr:phosphohistidine phosphatase SixA [Oleiharenicola lentus]
MRRMTIYLIRHAHAVEGDDDARRPLSDKGRRQIRAMAKFLRRSGRLKTREFWHSPLERAKNTAALLAGDMELDAKLSEVAGVEPYANPATMAAKLKSIRRSVAVVGHEPHLSALATLLILGRAEHPVLVLKKGAVAALERKDGRWALRWQVSPKEIA